MHNGTQRSAPEPWRLVAGPFTSASRMRDFLTALAGLAGVTELVAERFQQGELALRLRYAGERPLAEALAGLTARVEPAGCGTLRLVLAADTPACGSPPQD